jgi:hypothetical protein
MENLINKIENLENKRDNGTITMEEEVVFLRLVELAENFLSK